MKRFSKAHTTALCADVDDIFSRYESGATPISLPELRRRYPRIQSASATALENATLEFEDRGSLAIWCEYTKKMFILSADLHTGKISRSAANEAMGSYLMTSGHFVPKPQK